MTDIIAETKKFISECWENVFSNVYGTVVYIDYSAAECLHWYTNGKGYLALKSAGAIAIHELGMYHFRYAEVKNAKKAVIVSTASDPAFYQRTIKMILAKNAFHSCTIYCSIPCCTTNYLGIRKEAEEELDYVKLKRNIKAWMTSGSLSQDPLVNIVHIPLFLTLLNNSLFVTPPFGDIMPPLDTNISNDTLNGLNFLANSFYKLFTSINARVDIYSVGKLSDLLAENLESYAVSVDRRDHTQKAEIGVSLILMDRTLDLCTPTSYSTESFLTKILQMFPSLPHHNNDVAISMSPMFGTVEGVQRALEVPGCLAGIDKNTMDLLISEKEKTLLAMADQSLNNMILTKDSPKLKTPVRISGHSLEKALGKIRITNTLDSMTICTEKLQTILAVVEASTSQKISQLELLTSLEKLALQNLSVSRESSSILTQLSNVIRTRIHRGLETENLLALLMHVYALTGTQITFSTQQERQLEESIADAIFEDFQILKDNPSTNTTSTYQRTLLLLGVNDTTTARETSHRIAERIISIFRLIAEQRSALQDYRFCMIKPNSREAIRCVGLLEQMTKDILCSGVGRELKDLHQRSSSLISTGFSLFSRGRGKRHPRDNPYILIYVIGGITAEEAKIIRETVSAHNKDKTPHIILGGSKLLNPLDVVDKILFS